MTMNKFGVDEEEPKNKEKTSSPVGVCPRCGAKVDVHGQVRLCEKCGSQPFEKEKKG